MNSIKKVILVITLFSLIFFQNIVMTAANDINKNYSSRKTYSVESITNKDSTHFEIRLLKGSVATFAREKWKKGDTIVINLKSIKRNRAGLEVGILPAEKPSNGWGYNDYEAPIKKTVKTTEDQVEFTIPSDGEYGIYVKDMTSTRVPLLPIFGQKETVSRKSEEKTLEKDNGFDFRKNEYVEFELEVNKMFLKPLTK